VRPIIFRRDYAVIVAAIALFFFALTNGQTQQAQPSQMQSRPVSALHLPEAPQPQNLVFMTEHSDDTITASLSQAQVFLSSQQPMAPTSGSTAPIAIRTSSQTKQEERDKAEQQLKQEEQQRLLGTVPNFNVVLNGQALPLTGAQKWNLALHGMIDPFYVGWSFVIGGGYSELIDSNSGYGWGPAGYFKRVGASYADNVNGTIIGNAILPQLLHQDPRYFRKGTGSIKGRMWVAARSTFECHGDNGKNQFNISNILGNYISGAISNAYYPSNQRGVVLTLENGTDVTLFGALGGQFYEFAPDLIRVVFHRHAATPTQPGAVAVTP